MSSETGGSVRSGPLAYFRRVAPGDTPPPPPPELALWTSQTSHGLLFGMLLGGWSGIRQARKSAHVKPSAEGFKNAQHRVATYFVREGILMGARTGAFVSILSATALITEASRGVRDPWNITGAAAFTCGVVGGAIGGLRAAAGSSAFGAAVGGILGVGQHKMEHFLKDNGFHVSPLGLVSPLRTSESMNDSASREAADIAASHVTIQNMLTTLEGKQQERSGT